MAGKLLSELKQTKAFASVEMEAYLNLLKTVDLLQQGSSELFRKRELTETQYNVLRILRGAGTDGLRCSEIGERMVTRDPDITRLLDRLEKHGWIERQRGTQDRRVVTVRISGAGQDLLDGLDDPVKRNLERMLGGLGPERLAVLIGLLEEIRNQYST